MPQEAHHQLQFERLDFVVCKDPSKKVITSKWHLPSHTICSLFLPPHRFFPPSQRPVSQVPHKYHLRTTYITQSPTHPTSSPIKQYEKSIGIRRPSFFFSFFFSFWALADHFTLISRSFLHTAIPSPCNCAADKCDGFRSFSE